MGTNGSCARRRRLSLQQDRFGHPNRRAGDCASQIVAVTRWARARAIADGISYRLNVDPQQGRYWLTMQDPAGVDFGPVGEEFGRVFVAPEGITLAWAVPPQQQQQASTGLLSNQASQQPAAQSVGPYVEFRPDGRTDPAVLRLTDTGTNAVVEVACPSATEMFRVTTGARPGQR